MGKINVYEKIMMQNRKKEKFLHKSPSNTWYRNGIHSLISRADARGSAYIICRM